MPKHWFSFCPSCGREGQLIVMKRHDNGQLFLECDECSAAWSRPEDIGVVLAFWGFDVASDFANSDDISNAGWTRYDLKQTRGS